MWQAVVIYVLTYNKKLSWCWQTRATSFRG